MVTDFDFSRQRRAISDATRVVGVIGDRSSQLRPIEQLAQTPKQPIVGGRDRDVPVGTANGLIRRGHPMRRSHRLRRRLAAEVLRRFPHRHRDAGIDQRRVDVLAAAGSSIDSEARPESLTSRRAPHRDR